MARGRKPLASERHALAVCLLSACSGPAKESDIERGGALFSATTTSPSTLNFYSCATCHDTGTQSSAWLKPGATLAGVIRRASFWGEQEVDLFAAIDACRREFMGANQPLDASDPEALALYAYLSSLEPLQPNPVPFTVVREIEPLPRGDRSSGERVFAQACLYCHGAPHTGAGRAAERVPVLPEDTLAAHADLSARVQRLVFIEKTRHGSFLGYGGDMPPFSREVLSDARVSDVLEALSVLGE
jgi:thiosulfate dehydrogenase